MNTRRYLCGTPKTESGFSLIEVVLALSIVAVGLVTIIGLFPQGLTSAKNAVDDSICGMIVQDVIASRKIDLQNPVTSGAIIGQQPPDRFYTANGTDITGTSSATNAMFRVIVTPTPVTDLPVSTKIESTRVDIMWPWLVSSLSVKTPPPPNTNTFYTEIAQY